MNRNDGVQCPRRGTGQEFIHRFQINTCKAGLKDLNPN